MIVLLNMPCWCLVGDDGRVMTRPGLGGDQPAVFGRREWAEKELARLDDDVPCRVVEARAVVTALEEADLPVIRPEKIGGQP